MSCRVRVSLERYFADERARVWLALDGRWPRVDGLAAHLRALAGLRGPFCLLRSGHLLPPDEPLAPLLRDGDCISVVPVPESWSGFCAHREEASDNGDYDLQRDGSQTNDGHFSDRDGPAMNGDHFSDRHEPDINGDNFSDRPGSDINGEHFSDRDGPDANGEHFSDHEINDDHLQNREGANPCDLLPNHEGVALHDNSLDQLDAPPKLSDSDRGGNKKKKKKKHKSASPLAPAPTAPVLPLAPPPPLAPLPPAAPPPPVEQEALHSMKLRALALLGEVAARAAAARGGRVTKRRRVRRRHARPPSAPPAMPPHPTAHTRTSSPVLRNASPAPRARTVRPLADT